MYLDTLYGVYCVFCTFVVVKESSSDLCGGCVRNVVTGHGPRPRLPRKERGNKAIKGFQKGSARSYLVWNGRGLAAAQGRNRFCCRTH